MVALVETPQTLEGLGREDRPVEALRFDAQAVVERSALPGAGGLQVGAQRGLGERGDCLRQLERALYASAGGHDLVDEADAFGFAGVDHPPGDDQFDRAAISEDAGEPLCATVGQPDVPASASDAERGVLVGDRHVGPAGPLQPACVGDAVDGRDGGLVDVGPPRRSEHARSPVGRRLGSRHPAPRRSPP